MMRTRDVFVFWLPLFASWLLMASEGPLLSAAINRLPDEVSMLAALGIAFSIAITIESPVINLLATATALVRDRSSYLLVRRFTLHNMAFVTLVASLVAWSPLFDLVVLDWLETPANVARHVRTGLRILVPWSAFIGWRRFLQGVLIACGDTRKIASGTAARLVATVGTAFGLATTGALSGIAMAGWAMVAGVAAEAFYIHHVARARVEHLLAGGRVEPKNDESIPAEPIGHGAEPIGHGAEPIGHGAENKPIPKTAPPIFDSRSLFWFHLPLTATSLLTLLSQPLVTSTLTRLDRPTLNLAAWPLIFQAMLVLRAGALALPEVVIALADRRGSTAALRRFTFLLAAAGSAVLVILVTTPLADFYLLILQDTTPDVAELARAGLVLFIPLPALATLVSWQRGWLIAQRRTRWVNEGMAIQLLVVATFLAVALQIRSLTSNSRNASPRYSQPAPARYHASELTSA